MISDMKTIVFYCFVVIVLLVPVTLFGQINTMSITIKEAQVRSSPSFLGKIVAVLPYGAQIEVQERAGDWVKMELPSGYGWIHSSALSRKKIVLSAGEGGVETGASGEEIALAGKGFNEQVENQYQSEQHLDYTWVDRMEEFVITPEQAVEFLDKGTLRLELGL